MRLRFASELFEKKWLAITGIRANIPRIVFCGGMVRPWKTRAGWICQTFRWFGAEALYFAKLHALTSGIPRPKDLDDLQSIYAANGDDMDTAYLAAQMRRFALIVPRTAEPFLPVGLLALSRDIKRQLKLSS